MLFILAIDPIHHLLHLAAESSVLLSVRARAVQCRISLYVDDVGIFANPIKEELILTNSIPDYFVNANILVTNLLKTEVFPIRC